METSNAGIGIADNERDACRARSDAGNAAEAASDGAFSAPEEDTRQRSARASQRITALGEMTRGIAHDFRNILTMIESGIRLAEDNLADAGKCRTCLDAAHQGVGRGLALTSRLLAFARPGKTDVHPEDANALLRELALFLKYGAGPGIRIRLDLADDIPVCLIDPSQFNAAILNLVVNARDAMPGGGEIRISTASCAAGPPKRGDVWLCVRVSDDGEGMSAETVRRVFDPYFTTKGNTGTGLGVPQVHAFMRSIGGHVRVSSEPGVGTSFDLLFPAQGAAHSPPDNLWLQIDRWVNEGGRPGPMVRGTASSAGVHVHER
jgi:signal transduction histidine kinase